MRPSMEARYGSVPAELAFDLPPARFSTEGTFASGSSFTPQHPVATNLRFGVTSVGGRTCRWHRCAGEDRHAPSCLSSRPKKASIPTKGGDNPVRLGFARPLVVAVAALVPSRFGPSNGRLTPATAISRVRGRFVARLSSLGSITSAQGVPECSAPHGP